jgi:transposase
MGGALPMHIRSLIIEALNKGNCTVLSVSRQQGLSYSTVRKLWKRYKAEGAAAIKPHYERCGPHQPKTEALIYRCALWLKRHHPGWGAALIRVIVQQRYSSTVTSLPSVRTLQCWFKAQHLYPPKGLLSAAEPSITTAVHDTWQIDAKEKLCLPSGQKACYLTVVDEHSGSLLKALVFPLYAYQ